MEKKILIKVSGKLLNPDNPHIIKGYAYVLNKLYSEGYRIAVIVGGGKYARNYIECTKILGLNNAQADIVGTEIARVNALLLALSIGDNAYIPIPRNIEEIQRAWNTNKIVAVGGLQPGQSTAGVAAIVAETLGIKKLLYATDVEGVYDRDPKKYSNARKLDRITVDELAEVLSQRYEAGGYELLDPIAIKIIRRSCIEVTVYNGTDPANVYSALEGTIGTKIQSC